MRVESSASHGRLTTGTLRETRQRRRDETIVPGWPPCVDTAHCDKPYRNCRSLPTTVRRGSVANDPRRTAKSAPRRRNAADRYLQEIYTGSFLMRYPAPIKPAEVTGRSVAVVGGGRHANGLGDDRQCWGHQTAGCTNDRPFLTRHDRATTVKPLSHVRTVVAPRARGHLQTAIAPRGGHAEEPPRRSAVIALIHEWENTPSAKLSARHEAVEM